MLDDNLGNELHNEYNSHRLIDMCEEISNNLFGNKKFLNNYNK